MIKIYYKKGCNSTQRALYWFEKYQIKIDMYNINSISKTDMIEILSLSDKGIDSVIKNSSRISPENKQRIRKIKKMSFNECIDYLILHPKLLQTPIILGKKKCLIGYNINDIRQFLPKKYRRKEF